MKRVLHTIVSVILVAALSACGKSASLPTLPPPPDVGPLSVTATSAPPDAGSSNPAETDAADAGDMTITWGYPGGGGTIAWGNTYVSTALDERAIQLADDIGNRFGVTIQPQKWAPDFSSGSNTVYSSDVPDVFVPFASKDILINAGLVREIPMDMIRQYAPAYADMLAQYPYISQYLSFSNDGDGLYGLSGYNNWDVCAQTFSVYRLDWLEALNIVPHGTLTEVADRVYFTDQPFTQDEFTEIMDGFTNLSLPGGTGKTYGMALENTAKYVSVSNQYGADYNNFKLTSSLYGMWGLNYYSTEENGKFAFTACADGYKNYLFYMQSLARNGDILSCDDPNSEFLNANGASQYGIVGWRNDNVRNLFADLSAPEMTLLKYSKTAKLLIAPPETGTNGKSGVSVDSNESFNPVLTTCVNSNVDDAKLAVILQIFNALSYNPDFWLESNYGREGIDWNWAGDKYNSKVVATSPDATAFTTFFCTGVNDSALGDYTLGVGIDQTIAEYIRNNGERLALYQTYLSNMTDDTQKQLNNFDPDNSKYNSFRTKYGLYLTQIISGEKDVNATWNDYVKDLGDTYLNQYYAIYGLN